MQLSWLATDRLQTQKDQAEQIDNSPMNSQDEASFQDQLAEFDFQAYLASESSFNCSYKHLQSTFSAQFNDQSEGYFVQFQTDPVSFNEARSSTFNEFTHELISRDFSYFSTLWNNAFKTKLEFIIDNWATFKAEYKEPMELFLTLVSRKLQSISIYDNAYPGLQDLITKISKKLQYKRKLELSIHQQLKEDALFYHYLNEQQARAQKAGSYFFKFQSEQKQQIGSYIVENKYYKSNQSAWKLFFFIGAALKRYNIDTTRDEDIRKECKKIYKFAELVLKNYELTQPSKRICCSKFFYMNFNICPLDCSNVICRPRTEFLKNRVHKLYEKESKNLRMQEKEDLEQFGRQMKELMLDVVGLLNSGGGVLLLFAKKHYLETWVQGESILEEKKKQYIKLIRQGLEGIRPVVRMEQEICLRFVSIVKNPYEYDYLTDLEDEKDRSVNRNYIQGLYCPRLTVVPAEAERMYYYQNNRQEAVSAIVDNNERITLKGEKMFTYMKRKFQNFYVSEADAQDEQTRELLARDHLIIEKHTCQEPYLGHPMHIQQQRKPPKEVKQFKYMSMLVAHKNNHADIQRKLNSKGIQCLIADTFHSFKLKSSNSSAPLYHNVRFDQLYSEISQNKVYEYNGRYILIIAVTSYIKLINRPKEYFPKSSLGYLCGYLDKLYPGTEQVLSLYSFTNELGEAEQYIKASTKESSLLVYYLLHDRGEKSIFKNPKNLEKIPEAQRADRWKLIYSAGGSSK